MKKRIVCFVLTLIMLIGLVPVSALPAAAATYSVSESAITVLKQLEGYSKSCNDQSGNNLLFHFATPFLGMKA